NKVAIGYKNPLCLTRAKQAQPALYNGHEILKDNHAWVKVHNSEDTLEIVELTRKKMNAKMTDLECVTHKVKIAPHDYSKENLLATFTPQKQLTPEQIYWTNDLMKLKSEALKEKSKVSRPIKAFTVITPSAITDGEWGFEQTKACYLQEVIPFFQTIKDNFEGIQKALTREVKQMKDVFKELEAEVSQCAVDRKHDAIDLKNLLIANDNLIVECLSKEVFSVVTKSELNVARFAKMPLTRTKHAVDVEPIIPRLRNIREAHLDYLRHLKESVETIHDIVEEAKVVRPLDRSIVSACRYTQHSQDLLEYAIGTCPPGSQPRAKQLAYTPLIRKKQEYNVASKLADHSLRAITRPIGSRPLKFDSVMTNLVLSWVMVITWLVKASSPRKHSCYVRDTNGVDLIKGSRETNLYTISVKDMMKSSPICLLSKASKNKSWLWHRHLNHLNFGTINDLARKDLVRGLPRFKFEKDLLCSACQLGKSKKRTHKPKAENTNLEVLNTLYTDLCGPMRVQTINGKKYILVIVDDYSRFTWVKFLRSKDETLDTVPRTPQQNGVVKRRNRTLVEAARTMLIFSKAPMFLWAEAMATACYTQNRSLIHTHHHKTSYELVHNKKHDLTFFKVFGALCYPINNSEDLRKLQPTTDTGIFIGYAPSRKGTRSFFSDAWPNKLRPCTQSGSCNSLCTPTNKELEILFQPMFDEYLEPFRAERLDSPAQAVHVLVSSAGTPLSTTIDQDAPSPHISPSSSALQSHSLPLGVIAKPHFMENHNVSPVDNNPFVNVFAPEPHSEASSSRDISSNESPYVS
nr:integrase, catalytic region, zinc finger, CCHC-type, peptidase aspartic, catalytic [Tanacetum cinerariifolium]